MEPDSPQDTLFDPLSNLGITEADIRESLLSQFRAQDCSVLPSSPSAFDGCGVYALYYHGDYPRYEPISNTRHNTSVPIYVGKASPSGTRKGGAHLEPVTESKLAGRLRDHRKSIEQVDNLSINEFRCRYLSMPSIWIRYAEQILIGEYAPWWNKYIDGFGLHDVGSGRAGSEMSTWDAIHPGREWVDERNLALPIPREDVWEQKVAPAIESAKQDRTYKDKETFEHPTTRTEYAPSSEEASLFEFESDGSSDSD